MIDYSTDTGATRSLSSRVGYLTEPNQGLNAADIALNFVTSNRDLLGLEPTDLLEYEVTDLVENTVTGSTHIYFGQMHAGLPVYNGQLHVNVNRDGRVISVNNGWLPGLAAAVNTLAPVVAAPGAVDRATRHLGVPVRAPARALGPPEGTSQTTRVDQTGRSAEPIAAGLMWLPIRNGEARLVWNFQIHTDDRDHAYDMTVDAASGDVWTRFDWVAGDQHSVYPIGVESPNHTSPVPPGDGRVTVVNPSNAAASPFGWHDTNGVAGAEFTGLRGNNVHAYEDSDGNNTPPGSEPTCGASLDCLIAIDLTAAPDQYVPASVTNLSTGTMSSTTCSISTGSPSPPATSR